MSDACSTARNGPTSLPDGEMTPIVAATSSSSGSRATANTAPAATMRSEPAMSTRRRPMRSACVVSHRLMNVSPTRVRLSNNPICGSGMPSADR